MHRNYCRNWIGACLSRTLQIAIMLHYRKNLIALCLAFIVSSVLLPGCAPAKKKLPTLYPVHGRVQFKDGRPVTAGLVLFQSESNTRVTSTGAIKPDGTFMLSSFIDSERLPGAPAGPHRVQIAPPMASGDPSYPTTMLEKTLDVKPGDNEFTLVVSR